MPQFDPNDLLYPSQDDRFAVLPDALSLAASQTWLASPPPEPCKATGEGYMPFVRRQTSYIQYRQGVSDQRDRLTLESQALLLPKTPVGDDIQAARDWIQRTGQTPLEFLARTYRDPSYDIKHRIVAATKLMDYIHRRMPTTIEAEAVIADANGAAKSYASKLMAEVLALRQDAKDRDDRES